jgi:NAD(P)-dependent dehydrogenase (short-subunit alcohol dehydrogenase family)
MQKLMNQEKIAIITGGSRGIGAETARLLAANGYSVCVNYVRNEVAAKKVKDEISTHGGHCITVKADVSDSREVSKLFETVDHELGTLSVLVNNAGILNTQCRLDEISEERFQKVFQTNVMSCFFCCKEAIKRMSKKYGGVGGAIVNVSSVASKSGSPNEYVDYAASKGAIDSLTRGLALEVAPEGEPDRVKRLEPKIPLLRGGQPEEVANAILWLATEKSSFVTGSFIDPSGGL